MAYTNEEIEIKFSKKDTIYLTIILVLICIMALVCVLVPRYYKLQQTIPPLNNEATGQSPSAPDNKASGKNEADSSKTGTKSNNSADDSTTDSNANGSTSSETDINPNDSEDKGSSDVLSASDSDSTTADNKDKSDNPSSNADNNPAQETLSEASQDPAYYTIQVIQALKNVDAPYSASKIYLNGDGTLNYALLDPMPSQMEEIEALAKGLYKLINSYTSNGTELSTSLIRDNDELYNAINNFTNKMDWVADN